MYCHHRFYNYHQNILNSELFPDWTLKYLFIGTFNPSWNNSNANNADYFYSRSTYLWEIITRFFNHSSLKNSSVDAKIKFCTTHGIGFTDLIKGIDQIDFFNPLHQQLITSYKDQDLLNIVGAGAVIDFN